MGLNVTMPNEQDIKSSPNFLAKEGTYHLQVTHTDEQPVSKKGEAIDGFAVELSVLDGDHVNGVCPEKGKKVDIVFFNPKLNATEGDIKWKRAKQGAFLIAAGLVDESKCGQDVNVELADAVNRQLVATLQFGTDEQGNKKKFLELHYANIYHVDDPRAKDCPKDAKALALVPKLQRRDPASFKIGDKDEAAKPASGAANGSQSKTPIDDDLGEM